MRTLLIQLIFITLPYFAYSQVDSGDVVIIKVIDANTNKPLPKATFVVISSLGLQQEFYLDTNTVFKYVFPVKAIYQIYAKEDKFFNSEKVRFNNKQLSKDTVVLSLKSCRTNCSFYNYGLFFFDYNSSTLSKESPSYSAIEELKELKSVLVLNKINTIYINLRSEYKEQKGLSIKRATVIKEELIKHGLTDIEIKVHYIKCVKPQKTDFVKCKYIPRKDYSQRSADITLY
ncbi:MAG: hypothetical protein ABL940_01495 [Bacteroidia bacterium]